jgi:hypothetical protein
MILLKNKKEHIVDFLVGFEASTGIFRLGIKDKTDVKRISEKIKIGDIKLRIPKIEYQLAEPILVYDDKREYRFDIVFRIEVDRGRSPHEMATSISKIVKDSIRPSTTDKEIRKWFETVKKSYVRGKRRKEKEKFFASLAKKLEVELDDL